MPYISLTVLVSDTSATGLFDIDTMLLTTAGLLMVAAVATTETSIPLVHSTTVRDNGIPDKPHSRSDMAAILNRLESLERKMEAGEKQRRWERAKWADERETMQRSIHHLQEENRQLLKDSGDWRSKWAEMKGNWQRLKARTDLLETLLQQCDTVKDDDAGAATPETLKVPTLTLTNHTTSSKQVPVAVLAEDRRRAPQIRADDINSLEPVVTQLSQRLNEVGAEVEALRTVTTQQDERIQEAATSTFVRWGRSTCPSSAELIYTGAAGGTDYRGSGSSTTVLCLPLDPVFDSLTKPYVYAELWGAEYQTHEANPTHSDKDPVCAVCRTPRPTTIMIPATNRCHDGWTLEYSGYLMGSYPSHASGHEFVCMDADLEDRVGSEQSQEGALMYYTFTRCSGSSLPCPPYVQDKAVTCAVCSM